MASRVFAFGSVIATLVWGIEWHQDVITAWDRWLVPVIAALFALTSWSLHTRPASAFWPMVIGTLAFNIYLVASTLLVIFAAPTAQQQYQLFTGLYWQPLGYAAAFLFLPARAAVGVSVVVYAAMFIPLGTLAWTGRAESLGASFVSLVGVMAAAQVGYIVMLLAVATLRAGYHRANEDLRASEHLANTDVLTGLGSRRACEASLRRALNRAATEGTPLSTMLVDIDHFKNVNDHHGHAVGDRVLIDVARVLTSQLRGTDTVGRWGGEEFLVIADGAPIKAALQLADRLREAVAEFPFEHGERITLSVGLAQFLPGDDAHTLLVRADRALYRAKREGRNRSVAESLALASRSPPV